MADMQDNTRPTARSNQVATFDVSFYDRATNDPIEPLTNPKFCIEPVAQMTMYKQGKKFAAVTKLPIRNVTHTYKKTLRQRLFRQNATTYTRNEFDFDRAVKHIVTVTDLATNSPNNNTNPLKSANRESNEENSA